jgi:hypothetical protein
MANKSLNTRKYSTFLAKQFVNSVKNAAIANAALSAAVTAGFVVPYLYLTVGRPQVWENEPNDPDAPTADTQSVDFGYWRDLLGAKLVGPGDVALVIPRRDWAENSTYDQYDDTNASLFASDFYVVDQPVASSYYYVYKCLWNNEDGKSTVPPSSIAGNTSPVRLEDNYVWQYLYRIEPDNAKFVTSSWIPVFANTTVAGLAAAAAGRIPTEVPLIINSGGQDYNPSLLSAISVNIDGDGSNASIILTTDNFTDNAVSSLNFTQGGLGYTRIDSIAITQTGVSNTASIRAIIPPYPNHGYDPTEELGAAAVMVSVNLEYAESDRLTTVNDYRRIMLVSDPLLANSAQANGTFYQQTYNCVLTSNSAIFAADDLITVSNTTYQVTARVVDVITVAGQKTIRLTDISDKGRASAFVAGDLILSSTTGVKSGVLGTITEPELQPYSGNVLYVNHHSTVTRGLKQIENFRLVFQLGS